MDKELMTLFWSLAEDEDEQRISAVNKLIDILNIKQEQVNYTRRLETEGLPLLLPCISWPRVVSWPSSSYFEISINLKACIILEWSIIIRFIITTTFKTCATTHLSV